MGWEVGVLDSVTVRLILMLEIHRFISIGLIVSE